MTGGTVGGRTPVRRTTDALSLVELSIGFLGRCGWMFTEWERWVVSRQLLPLVRALKQHQPLDPVQVDALYDQLAAFQDRYDLEDLDRAMYCLLAARLCLPKAAQGQKAGR